MSNDTQDKRNLSIGDMTPRGDEAIVKQLASRLTYPDPFRPSGIDFDLPENAWVTLKIFNTTGREVATLIDNVMYGTGTHHVEFGQAPWNHISHEQHDSYFYRLSIEHGGRSSVDTKKIIFAKS